MGERGSSPPSLRSGEPTGALPPYPRKRDTSGVRLRSPRKSLSARPPGACAKRNPLEKGGIRAFVVSFCVKRRKCADDAARKRGSSAREAPSQEHEAKRKATSEGAVPERSEGRARRVAWHSVIEKLSRAAGSLHLSRQSRVPRRGSFQGVSGAEPLSARPSEAMGEAVLNNRA